MYSLIYESETSLPSILKQTVMFCFVTLRHDFRGLRTNFKLLGLWWWWGGGVRFVISLGHNDRDQHLIVFSMKFVSPRLKTCVDVGKTEFP